MNGTTHLFRGKPDVKSLEGKIAIVAGVR